MVSSLVSPPRKMHYAHHLSNAFLKGLGGPGAPHLIRMERIRDAGTGESFWWNLLSWDPSLNRTAA